MQKAHPLGNIHCKLCRKQIKLQEIRSPYLQTLCPSNVNWLILTVNIIIQVSYKESNKGT